MQESGLGYRRHETPTNEFYVTTIDPIELGINMSSNGDSDEILFHDDFNYFGGNIIAWQKAKWDDNNWLKNLINND